MLVSSWIGRGKFWDAKKFKQYKSKIRLYSVQQPGPEDSESARRSRFLLRAGVPVTLTTQQNGNVIRHFPTEGRT